jgi:hypothetical protein
LAEPGAALAGGSAVAVLLPGLPNVAHGVAAQRQA